MPKANPSKYPDQKQLKAFLTYDPETGIFTRNHNTEKYHWYYSGKKLGSFNGAGYWQISYDRRGQLLAHILAWIYMTGGHPQKNIDHKNLDKADNRWSNLREATQSQNMGNAKLRPDNAVGLKGVTFNERQTLRPFNAQIRFGYKREHLGCFATAAEAHQAYVKRARELFGEFARVA